MQVEVIYWLVLAGGLVSAPANSDPRPPPVMVPSFPGPVTAGPRGSGPGRRVIDATGELALPAAMVEVDGLDRIVRRLRTYPSLSACEQALGSQNGHRQQVACTTIQPSFK